MSETFNESVVADGRTYREVEQGVQLFSATAFETGTASAGVVTQYFNFNPDSNRSFQPYVAITRCSVLIQVAPLTANIQWIARAGEWERYAEDVTIAPLPVTTAHNANNQAAAWFGFANLGRVAAGTTGSVEFKFENISTATHRILLEGLISDHPIAGRWWLSA